MRDPSRARDGEGHVPTAASEDGGALGEAALGEAAMVVVAPAARRHHKAPDSMF
jgi:hypothetical protein